jgi:hypothetical protein
MKRLLLTAAVLSFLAARSIGPAHAAGCSPLDCAPNAVALPGGLLAARPAGYMGKAHVLDLRTGRMRAALPAGILGGRLLVRANGVRVDWLDAASGRTVATRTLVEPEMALLGSVAPSDSIASLVGVSQDGRRAVLATHPAGRTNFFVVGAHGRVDEAAVGRGTWGFDALAGHDLYLLHYLRNGYEVQRFDLAANRLAARPLKDPNGSSLIWGAAWARLSSPDGRYLFTLYVAQDGGAMVHELDLRAHTARCVSLPGDGDANAAMSSALALSPDGRTLWVVSPGYGRATGIDVRAARVRTAFRFHRTPYLVSNDAAAAMAPGGRRIAVATQGRLWLVDLAHRTVIRSRRPAYALGFAPDGSRLWLVSGPARVSSLAF